MMSALHMPMEVVCYEVSFGPSLLPACAGRQGFSASQVWDATSFCTAGQERLTPHMGSYRYRCNPVLSAASLNFCCILCGRCSSWCKCIL